MQLASKKRRYDGKFKKTSAQAKFYRRKSYIPRQKLKPEIKTWDTSLATMDFNTTSAVATTMKYISAVPVGSDAQARIGKKICGKGIQIHAQILPLAANNIDKCVCMLVWIRTQNQAATLPAWTDILVSQSANALTNRDNASKFKILRRWEFKMSSGSTNQASPDCTHIINEFVKLPDAKYESLWTNSDTTGAINHCEKGAMLFCTVGMNAAAGSTLIGFSRYYFYDI